MTRSRTRLWVAVVVLLGLVGATGLVVVGRDGTSSPRSSGAAEAVDAAKRDAAIEAVLERRATAVLDRDPDGFLADVDRQDEDFLRSQEQLFANLEQLEFASWSYEVVSSYNRPHLRATYDVPYHLPAVLLHYALAGFDVAPVARPQVLTFVRRDGQWVIASDSDADSELPETGHADPWDRRAVVVEERDDVLVVADAEDRDRLPDLVRVAERAVSRVAQMWPGGWRRQVVLVAVRDQLLIETYFRTAVQSSQDVAAIAVPARDVVPGWSPPEAAAEEARHGPRSRVILNPRYFDPEDEGNLDVITHEVMHVATQARTNAGAPPWLSEGAAEYTAYRHLRPFAVDLPKSLRRQVRDGSVYLPTYDFYSGDVAANYLAGFLACAHVADRYGEATLRRLYDRLAPTPKETETLDRQEQAIRDVLGVTPERFGRDVAGFAARVSG